MPATDFMPTIEYREAETLANALDGLTNYHVKVTTSDHQTFDGDLIDYNPDDVRSMTFRLDNGDERTVEVLRLEVY